MSIFTVDYFVKHPEPFYELAKEYLDIEKYRPTLTHHFCAMLADQGVVSRYLTQNVDNLESLTSMDEDLVI